MINYSSALTDLSIFSFVNVNPLTLTDDLTD